MVLGKATGAEFCRLMHLGTPAVYNQKAKIMKDGALLEISAAFGGGVAAALLVILILVLTEAAHGPPNPGHFICLISNPTR